MGDRTFEVMHRAEERLIYFREVTRLARIERRYEQEQVFFGVIPWTITKRRVRD